MLGPDGQPLRDKDGHKIRVKKEPKTSNGYVSFFFNNFFRRLIVVCYLTVNLTVFKFILVLIIFDNPT